MIGSLILNEVINIARLSIPFVVLYSLLPRHLFSFLGIAISCLAVGAYVSYTYYKNTKNSVNRLQFIPSEQYMEPFHAEVTKCGLQPDKVCLRYAYNDDKIAQTMFNTIILDPMLWKGIADDPTCIAVKEVLKTHVVPGIPDAKKNLQAHINEALCADAQKFIFRHELGHIVYNYSYKLIFVTGLIGIITTLLGLLAAYTLLPIVGGVVTLILSIMIASSTDLLLTYSANHFFKAREEKKADLFARTYSSKEEIDAAARFFECYEQYAQEYRAHTPSLLHSLPNTILTGYPDGATRANYLRSQIEA